MLVEYFDHIDRGDAIAAAGLFAQEGRAELMMGRWVEGRENVGLTLGRILRHFERTSHHVTNPRLRTRGNEAELTTYVYAYHRLSATGEPWHLWARLRDRFVREGGQWLIAEHALRGLDALPDRRGIPVDWYPGHPGRSSPPLPDPGERARLALAAATRELFAGRRAVEEGGPLPSAHAALLAACAVSALGHELGAREALERARAAGLDGDAAWGTAAPVMRSGGENAALPHARALLAVFGPPPAAGGGVGRLEALVDCATSMATGRRERYAAAARAARLAGVPESGLEQLRRLVAFVAGADAVGEATGST